MIGRVGVMVGLRVSFLRLLLRRRFFFFQAEDGIRDYKVTGVQTCALPIFEREEFRNFFSRLSTSPPETLSASRLFCDGSILSAACSGRRNSFPLPRKPA